MDVYLIQHAECKWKEEDSAAPVADRGGKSVVNAGTDLVGYALASAALFMAGNRAQRSVE